MLFRLVDNKKAHLIKIKFARERNFQSRTEYQKYIRENKLIHIPAYPNQSYKEWEGWYEFLGTASTEKRFEEFIDKYKRNEV